MNARSQLSMFEPEGAEALGLLKAHLAEAERNLKLADHFELLRMPGAEQRAVAMAEQNVRDALVLAILLDLEAEAGL